MDEGRRSRPCGFPKGLFVIHDLRQGGAEHTFIQYVNRLREVRPYPVLVRPAMPWGDRLRPDVRLMDLERPVPGEGLPRDSRDLSRTDPFPAGSRWYERFAWVRFLILVRKGWRLAKLAERMQCEFVSTFLMESHVIGLTAKLLFRRDLKVVVNVHAQMSDHIRHHHPPAVQLVLRAFVRHVLPRADLIVAVAEGVKGDLTTRFGIPGDRITVVGNPMDVRAVREGGAESASWPLAGASGFRLVGAGRLVPLKGFDHLIRAFGELAGEVEASLVILGEGEDRGRLEALVADLGLEGRVALPGYRDNPWSIMALADLFVLSSLSEASPNVLGEALALGLPLVATDCSPGVREYVEPGPCGLLATPGDPGDLAAQIVRVLEDEALRERLSRNARRRSRAPEGADGVRDYERILRATVVDGAASDGDRAPGTAHPRGSTDT